MNNIRNFAIIAHIDHGKSTLADRFLELTGAISKEKIIPQYLDRLSLERERGITIKMQPVQMKYRLTTNDLRPTIDKNDKSSVVSRESSNLEYTLNLIDTPGHADFTYEVSRALKAVEGVIFLVDALKGVQAQSVFNFRKAYEQGLTIVPVINKIDLREANIERTEKQIVDLFLTNDQRLTTNEIFQISAKTGQGVRELLEAVIQKIPSPSEALAKEGEFQALIFDSLYDSFKGVLAYVRVFQGIAKTQDSLILLARKEKFQVKEVGIFTPDFKPIDTLSAGSIGYIATGIKEPGVVKIGDTIATQGASALEGFFQPKPNVFASFYPLEEGEFENLKTSLEKLQLNDPSISFERTESPLLGRGFRVGFLGKLHMEIIAGRLDEELKTEIIIGAPTVAYEVNGVTISSPTQYPEHSKGHGIKEPWVAIEIFSPLEYLGPIMTLMQDSLGVFKNTAYLDERNVKISFEMPLAQIVTQDFYDTLKSISQGYASAEYEMIGFRSTDNVRLDMLIAGDYIDAFSKIVPPQKAADEGRRLAKKLKDILPQAQFVISLQARVEGKVIAREDVPAMRKDVTAPLYGGDFTRKKKLLVKQREGKKRLRQFGRVQIPKEVFLKVI